VRLALQCLCGPILLGFLSVLPHSADKVDEKDAVMDGRNIESSNNNSLIGDSQLIRCDLKMCKVWREGLFS
jgi:hypothetical protein